jgi:hypothetical protein
MFLPTSWEASPEINFFQNFSSVTLVLVRRSVVFFAGNQQFTTQEIEAWLASAHFTREFQDKSP